MASRDDFRSEIQAQIDRAVRQGRPHLEINAGELHRTLGGYPQGGSHAMPSCCAAMYEEFEKGKAEIIFQTSSGHSASLTIRYLMPR
jgi:5-methylcytosine-specific restriction protein A